MNLPEVVPSEGAGPTENKVAEMLPSYLPKIALLISLNRSRDLVAASDPKNEY